jgi:hypothetical protein
MGRVEEVGEMRSYEEKGKEEENTEAGGRRDMDATNVHFRFRT